MAGYLAAGFPGDYYSDDLAKSFDFAGYFNNKRQQDAAMKNQEINRDMALEDLFQTRQMNPLRVQELQGQNEARTLENLGRGFDNTFKERKAKITEGIPVEEEIKAMRAKLAKEMSDSELAQEESAIKKALVHPSAAVRKQAQMLWENLGEIQKLRMGFQSKEDIAAMNAAQREQAARLATEQRDRALQNRAQAVPKDPKSYQEAATKFRIAAEFSDDPAEKQRLMALAQEFERAALTLPAAREAGKIDAAGIAGLPPKEVKPQLGAGGAAWLEKAKKLNPGMTEEQLIAEGKKRGKL